MDVKTKESRGDVAIYDSDGNEISTKSQKSGESGSGESSGSVSQQDKKASGAEKPESFVSSWLKDSIKTFTGLMLSAAVSAFFSYSCGEDSEKARQVEATEKQIKKELTKYQDEQEAKCGSKGTAENCQYLMDRIALSQEMHGPSDRFDQLFDNVKDDRDLLENVEKRISAIEERVRSAVSEEDLSAVRETIEVYEENFLKKDKEHAKYENLHRQIQVKEKQFRCETVISTYLANYCRNKMTCENVWEQFPVPVETAKISVPQANGDDCELSSRKVIQYYSVLRMAEYSSLIDSGANKARLRVYVKNVLNSPKIPLTIGEKNAFTAINVELGDEPRLAECNDLSAVVNNSLFKRCLKEKNIDSVRISYEVKEKKITNVKIPQLANACRRLKRDLELEVSGIENCKGSAVVKRDRG